MSNGRGGMGNGVLFQNSSVIIWTYISCENRFIKGIKIQHPEVWFSYKIYTFSNCPHNPLTNRKKTFNV